MLYRIIKKKSKQNFLDNLTIRIRIFWRFRCCEQVKIFHFQKFCIKCPSLTCVIFFYAVVVLTLESDLYFKSISAYCVKIFFASSLHLILYGARRLIIRLKKSLFWRKQNIKRLFKTFLFLCDCDAKFSFKWMKWGFELKK